MKADHNAPKRLISLLQKLGETYEVEPPPATDPVVQMVIGFLQWEATADMAEEAYTRLMVEMVDINELRVSHDHEVAAILGQDYPLAQARIARMRESLNAIFVREYGVAMHSIADAGKKEQRAYLDSLPGMVPYVAALVTLLSFGGHAMPVDEKLVRLLIDEQIADVGASCEHVESFLQRHIKASEAAQAHLLLQAWSDEQTTSAAGSDQNIKNKTKPSKTTKRSTASRARKK